MTNSPVVKLLMPILEGALDRSLEAVALAADVIAAEARFNIWFVDWGKKHLSGSNAIRVITEGQTLLENLEEEVTQFKIHKDNAKFEQALLVAREGFRKLIEWS